MEKEGKIYTVGTLRYNMARLLIVCFWVLWGIFWYDMIQYILVPTLMPLNFKALGASGEWMGVVLGSLPALANFFLNPIISTASDRTRTKMGRRMPFMLWSIPFVTFFGLLLGWLPLFRSSIASFFPSVNGNYLMLVLYSVVFLCFYIAGLLIGIISCYLAPDVIPGEFIGRFQVAKGLVATAAGFIFNMFLLKYAETHAQWLYTGIAALFAISFTGLCLFVKEGEYPPPEVPDNDLPWHKRTMENFRTYFKDCFSKPFYLLLFLGFALTNVSTSCRGMFNILFATRDLNLSTEQYGEIMAYGKIVSLGVLAVMMFCIDRFNALLLYFLTGVIVLFLNIWGYFWAVDYNSFLVIGLVLVLIYTMQSLASTPMLILLLPKEKYGQFCSAAMMITCICSVIGSWLAGKVVDIWVYRFIYVWDFVFTLAASVFLIMVYLRWKKIKAAESKSVSDSPQNMKG